MRDKKINKFGQEDDSRGLELSTYVVKAPRKTQVKTLEVSKPRVCKSTAIEKAAPNIYTQSQSTLRTRMSPASLYNMIKDLDPNQRKAVEDIGFGSLLTLGFGELYSKLNLFLVQNFEPYGRTLYLQDGKLNIDVEDVHLTLGLPMGAKVVKGATSDNDTEEFSVLLNKWRDIWGLKTGSPETSKMCHKILKLGSGDDFKRSFVVFFVSSCLNGHKSAKCNYKILFSLMRTNEISQLNWCQYTLKKLVEAVVCWRENPTPNFKGSVIFLMVIIPTHTYII
ncbi:uncharacterized protein [Spinacia oleracea]|uniref:Aminotransferase-like plant mobile domain-containing protein n=1 Tax=Spinacia oleracea TaxID=3562 RepID=A0ABM3QGP8_SPIOL|nr:uncharacterized protein LOC130459295 [Spinacia oleracea]XP_056682537.1 uncharacterized protein LOC130459295 [Spinacia oleracea]XP_056682538.1 uncharacterized protein LOC130459295 [Spinacia oleracea]